MVGLRQGAPEVGRWKGEGTGRDRGREGERWRPGRQLKGETSDKTKYNHALKGMSLATPSKDSARQGDLLLALFLLLNVRLILFLLIRRDKNHFFSESKHFFLSMRLIMHDDAAADRFEEGDMWVGT